MLAAASTGRAQGPARADAMKPVPAPMQARPPFARAPLPGGDFYAANLGITYQLDPYGRSFGARLTQYPRPGSAASQLQLEPGDMIVRLDGQEINGPNDVLNHYARTDVVFVNIRTGRPQAGVVFIPPNGGNPGPFPPQPPPPAYSLGIYAAPTVVTAPPYRPRPGQPRLIGPGAEAPVRGLQVTSVTFGGPAARAGLQVGDVIYQANNAATDTNEALRAVIASSDGLARLWVLKGGRYRDTQEIVVDMRSTPFLQPTAPQPFAAPAAAPAR